MEKRHAHCEGSDVIEPGSGIVDHLLTCMHASLGSLKGKLPSRKTCRWVYLD